MLNGVFVFSVIAMPAELACIAGELQRLVLPPPRAGEARLGVVRGEARLGVANDGEARLRLVMEGDGRAPAGEFIRPAALGVGECRIAGEFTLLDGRQCFTESEPDCESLLLLGDPGEDTITCMTFIISH